MAATKSADKPAPGADEHAALRKQLAALLKGGQAHVTFDDAVKDLPANLRGTIPASLPYSAWQLLEHLRITQRDILNFSAPPTGGYHPIQWPDDYWPKDPQPPNSQAWDESVQTIHADLKAFLKIIEDPKSDLFKPFRWAMARTSSAKLSSSPTTPPITSANLSSSAASSETGTNKLFKNLLESNS